MYIDSNVAADPSINHLTSIAFGLLNSPSLPIENAGERLCWYTWKYSCAITEYLWLELLVNSSSGISRTIQKSVPFPDIEAPCIVFPLGSVYGLGTELFQAYIFIVSGNPSLFFAGIVDSSLFIIVLNSVIHSSGRLECK